MMTNWNRSSFSRLPLDQKLFNGVMLLNLLIFIFDTGMWLSDGSPLATMRTVNYLSTTLYYLFNPIICLFWLMYTDIKIHESKYGLMRRMRFYVIPVVLSTILSLTSPWTAFYFIIDADNHYIRGPGFAIMALVAFIYLVYAMGMSVNDIVKNGWRESKEINLPLLIFPLVVTVSVAIQIRYFGVSIIWVCTMLTCTNVYLKMQNAQIATDHLTGVFNRRRLDQYLVRRIRVKRPNRLIFAVIIDIDAFKKINDTFGHLEGDRALVKVSEILRMSCRRSEAFVARLGGDEFIIVGEKNSLEEVQQFLEQLDANVAACNASRQLPYALTLSIGYAIFKEGDTVDTFLAAADSAMYQQKQAHQAAGA
jgi:diguanylate cyclase (GGDEF)-like protein